jgi:hypothetical protein
MRSLLIWLAFQQKQYAGCLIGLGNVVTDELFETPHIWICLVG